MLIGFSWFGGYALSLVFGARWEPMMVVYPFLALSYLTNAQFNFHSSVLYVLHRNWAVSWFHIVHIVLFAAAAWICVGRWGIVGYGYGEMVALLGYAVIHRSVRKAIGSPTTASRRCGGCPWPWACSGGSWVHGRYRCPLSACSARRRCGS